MSPAYAPGGASSANRVLNKAGKPELTLNPGRVSPQAYAFRDSRKPLSAIQVHGQGYFVVVCHLIPKAKMTRCLRQTVQSWSVAAPGTGPRINQFVRQILAVDPSAYVVVLGDLNDFFWSTPIPALQEGALGNLIAELAENDRYTYMHEGNAQALDHILVSLSLLSNCAILIWCISIKRPCAMSDHDPVYAVLKSKNESLRLLLARLF